jgi:hypothetical protein
MRSKKRNRVVEVMPVPIKTINWTVVYLCFVCFILTCLLATFTSRFTFTTLFTFNYIPEN